MTHKQRCTPARSADKIQTSQFHNQTYFKYIRWPGEPNASDIMQINLVINYLCCPRLSPPSIGALP